MLKKLVIIGAGGVGREIAAVLKKHHVEGYALAGFIDDGLEAGSLVNGLEVLGGISWVSDNHNDLGVVLGIGNPEIREKIAISLASLPVDYPTIIHPGTNIHDEERVHIGKGCYIADGCILTTDITIGDFCFINTACSLQHDTTIGDYSVLMPGVRITGGAAIGSGVYIAPNCAIAVKCTIENNNFIKKSKID